MSVDSPEPYRPLEPAERELVRIEQRLHLRRILISFIIVVILLPISTLGGVWSGLLIPLLLVAAWGFREALALRRSVRMWGAQS